MRDLIKAAIFAAVLGNGADIGQTAVMRLVDVGRAEFSVVANAIGAFGDGRADFSVAADAIGAFGDGRVSSAGFGATQPVRFGW